MISGMPALAQEPAGRADVQVGWSKERVRRLLGTPTHASNGYGAHGAAEVWVYGGITVHIAGGTVVAVEATARTALSRTPADRGGRAAA
jgi:hypothetical protein